MWNEFRIDSKLPYSSADQMGVLSSKVEYKYSLPIFLFVIVLQLVKDTSERECKKADSNERRLDLFFAWEYDAVRPQLFASRSAHSSEPRLQPKFLDR